MKRAGTPQFFPILECDFKTHQQQANQMKSLIRFFEENVEKFASNIYLWEKLQDKYEGTTYQETKRQAQEFGAGLMQLGIKKGDRVSLLADGSNSWVIGELGILYAGGVNVPLFSKA
ncbi:MAG: long-chain fatty acid--CoA ligase [Marinilabiliales bacterium]|nr:long-chain fatty acid--CoA ligase [Marinilabiliales bacterium]